VFVSKRIALPLLVICAAHACGFAQMAPSAAAAPRIIIELPDDLPPETVWVRYALYGPDGSGGKISRGETLRAESNSRHYFAALFGGAHAQYARFVIYAPGCQFAMYDLELGSDSDITKQFECDPLPTKRVHGFIPPNEIPPNIDLAGKKLDIAGDLDGNWVCEFFFRPRRETTVIEAGSCLGSDIPLGTLGELDRAGNGFFEIAIPNFTRDPVFEKFARQGKFGVIELPLKEKGFGRGLGTMKAADGPELGLNVQVEYHDPVIFTTVHH
jgi:hypothetical protein